MKSQYCCIDMFVCFKGRLSPLPDWRVDIWSIPQSRESPLRTSLRWAVQRPGPWSILQDHFCIDINFGNPKFLVTILISKLILKVKKNCTYPKMKIQIQNILRLKTNNESTLKGPLNQKRVSMAYLKRKNKNINKLQHKSCFHIIK